jgi:hypothetical protein
VPFHATTLLLSMCHDVRHDLCRCTVYRCSCTQIFTGDAESAQRDAESSLTPQAGAPSSDESVWKREKCAS